MVDNPFAFPFPDVRDSDGCGISEGSTGMTLRDWFAGQALAGLLANAVSFDAHMQGDPELIASVAGTFADAMLAARKGPGA